jgi:hypothetical protein
MFELTLVSTAAKICLTNVVLKVVLSDTDDFIRWVRRRLRRLSVDVCLTQAFPRY